MLETIKALEIQLSVVMKADDEDGLKEEESRTKQVTTISKQMIGACKLMLDANKFLHAIDKEVDLNGTFVDAKPVQGIANKESGGG